MSQSGVRGSFRAASLVLLALLVTSLCWAQSAPESQWLLIRIEKVKAGMNADYEGFQKEISAAYKKAGVPWRVVNQIRFGELRTYMSVVPLEKMADLDGPGPVEKALGKDAMPRIMATAAKLIDSTQNMAVRTEPTLGLNKDMAAPPAYVLVSHYDVAPGRGTDFEAWLKNDYSPGMKKGGIETLLVYRDIFGGHSYRYSTVRFLSKMGELDAGPVLVKALGTEGAAKVMAKTSGIVMHSQMEMWQARADLGYQPAPAAAGSH